MSKDRSRHESWRTGIKALAAIGLAGFLAEFVRVRDAVADAPEHSDADYAPYKSRAQVEIRGVFRDFKPRSEAGGHPDFGLTAAEGRGTYFDVVDDALDTQLRPALNTTGRKRTRDWTDAASRAICPSRAHIRTKPGDAPGARGSTEGGVLTSASTFAQWFRDVGPARVYAPMKFQLARDGSHYAFDDTLDTLRPGDASPDYSYTYELDTYFIHEKPANFYLSIESTGDVWAYVDNLLVIDSGKGYQMKRPTLAVEDTIEISNSARIVGEMISTNSTSAGAIRLTNTAGIEGNARVGPGGNPATGIVTTHSGAIAGTTGALTDRVPINIVSMPTGMPSSGSSASFTNRVETWSGDKRFEDLTIGSSSVITISGSVRVLVNKSLNLESSSKIIIPAGATLSMWVLEDVNIRTYSEINVTAADPNAFSLACMGFGRRLVVDNHSKIVGSLVCPSGAVEVGNSATVTGWITARSAILHNNITLNGVNSGTATLSGDPMWSSQRIELDRLPWLTDGNTHRLRLFLANRTGEPSRTIIRTNITTLNLARLPRTVVPEMD